MKLLRRVIGDIQRGENVDLYLTIPAAFVVGLINLVCAGTIESEIVVSLTLVVLGAVAVAILGNRYRVEQLAEKLSPSVESIFLDEFPENFKKDFEAASEIWLIGATLRDFLSEHYSIIERKIHQGHNFRVLIINPESVSVALSDMRAYSKPNTERARMEKRNALQYFCDLKGIAPERMLIKVIDHPLGHGLVALNPNSPLGGLYISYYPFKTAGGARPSFLVQTKDRHWYEHFKQEAENLWGAGSEWKCEVTTTNPQNNS